MGSAGATDKNIDFLAAISENIWQCYDKNGQESFRDEKLNFMLMDCEVVE